MDDQKPRHHRTPPLLITVHPDFPRGKEPAMHSYAKLIQQIEELGYTASHLNNTEVKHDSLDDECAAILWIKGDTIVAEVIKNIALCELDAPDRLEILEKSLELRK